MAAPGVSAAVAPGDLRLFAYGTLQLPEVLQAVIGVRWQGTPAELDGYARYRVRGKPYPAIRVDPAGSVAGILYSGLGVTELERLDSYEGELYERRTLSVRAAGTSLEAVGYVLCERHQALLSSEAWELATFEREHLAAYLQHIRATRRAP